MLTLMNGLLASIQYSSTTVLQETSPDHGSSVSKTVCSPSNNGSPTTKVSKRTHFSPHQIYQLEQFFMKSQFPTAKERETLAKELQLSAKHIQVWFQNHRAKYKRKEKKKEATQKSAVKLQPPSSWPAALPFDSSIGSVNLEVKSKKTELRAVIEKASSTASSDAMGGSTPEQSVGFSSSKKSEESSADGSLKLQTWSSSSPEKSITPYPLSPSSPLPTPHAPMRRHSSSVGLMDSPLSSSKNNSPLSNNTTSPIQSLSVSTSVQSPSSQSSTCTSSAGGPSSQKDSSTSTHFYSGDIGTLSLFESNLQMTDFSSTPILAESPVHLHDIMDDPDIASILREHLPAVPPPSRPVTAADPMHFHGQQFNPTNSFRGAGSTVSAYYQSSHVSEVGYGGPSHQQQPFPSATNYNISPSLQPPPVYSPISSTMSSTSTDPAAVVRHSLKRQTSNSTTSIHQQHMYHGSSSSNHPRAVRPPFTQNNPYQLPVPPLPNMHAATGPYAVADMTSPQYPLTSPMHNHPLTQVYLQQPNPSTCISYQMHSSLLSEGSIVQQQTSARFHQSGPSPSSVQQQHRLPMVPPVSTQIPSQQQQLPPYTPHALSTHPHPHHHPHSPPVNTSSAVPYQQQKHSQLPSTR